MYPNRKEFFGKILHNLERSGELLPGSAEVIAADLPRASGDFPEDVRRLFDALYGRAARPGPDPGDPELPALPPSPYLNPSRPTRDMPPVAAALKRLGLIRRPEDEAELAAKFVKLTTYAEPGRIAEALVARLFDEDDRQYWPLLKDRPEVPVRERRAREALEQVKRYLAPHIDLDGLARKWHDLGSLPRDQACQRAATRLRDPSVAADLCRHGQVPEIDPQDEAFLPDPALESLADEMAQHGRYNV